MSIQLKEQIEASELTLQNKEDFIFFLENISHEEIAKLTENFNDNPSELVLFWTILKEKLIFMDLLDQTTTFSTESKDAIKQRVSEMNAEEFNAFLEAFQKVTNGANPEDAMNSQLKELKNNTKEISSLAKKITSNE